MPGYYYRDALCIGLGGSAIVVGAQYLASSAATHETALHRAMSSSFGSYFDTSLPAAAILGSTILQSLFASGFIALIAAFIAARIRQVWLRVLLLVATAFAFVDSDWVGPGGFLKSLLGAAAAIAIAALVVRYVLRMNLLGYFLLIAGSTLLSNGMRLLQQPDNFFRLNGFAVIAGLILLFAWPFLAWRLRGTPAPAYAPPSWLPRQPEK
jgi:hypothetical protein